MDDLPSDKLEVLFEEALALPPEQRAAFLDDACGADEALRAELVSLLALSDEASAFLNNLAEGVIAPTLAALLDEPNAETPTPPLQLIGQTISHYRIVEHLGGGGMGIVYKAEDTRLKRLVALKFLLPGLTHDDDRDRFIQEAQAASALDHTNIAVVHEIDKTEDGRLFIVMAFYEGETLKKKIARGPLPVEEALDYAVQMAQGLAKAHEADIVHRDVKPANVMITDQGQVKLVDFGLAKMVGTERTQTGMTLGTVAYMSPEQTRGEAVDRRTDLWSLGVVLYEMLTGQRPFKGDHAETIIHAIRHDEPGPIKALRPKVPETLAQVIETLLEKKPEARYEQASDVVATLEAIRQDPTTAVRMPAARLVPKRRRGFVYAALAVVAVIVGGLALFWPGEPDAPAEGEERTRQSIAVLPFENMSADPEQEQFSYGLAYDLINALTKIKTLRVAAFSSTFSDVLKGKDVREIGQQLNVETILTGSVRKSGNRLRITAQLVNVADGFHLWSQQYELMMGDVFAIQDEITLAIVEKMEVELLSEEQLALEKRYTEDLEAYNLYLKGRHFWLKRTPDDLQRSIMYFEQAIERDPGYALAYAALADAYNALAAPPFAVLTAEEAYPQARAAAQKALDLDDTLGEAHAALGQIYLEGDWDWARAEQAFKRAIALNPSYAGGHMVYALLLMHHRRHNEARAELDKAVALDPLSPSINALSGLQHYYARRYDRAIEVFKQTIEIVPDFWMPYSWSGMAYLSKGMYPEAITSLEHAMTLPESFWETVPDLVMAYAQSGELEKAEALLHEMEVRAQTEHFPPYAFAMAYVGLGRLDEAFAWFDRALQERDNNLQWINVNQLFDSIRDDPRFIDLLRRIGFEASSGDETRPGYETAMDRSPSGSKKTRDPWK